MAGDRKSIKFNVLLDTSEVPQAVKAMQRQMEQASQGTRLSQQGIGGMSIPKPDEIAKSKIAAVQAIREQAQHLERLNGIITKRGLLIDREVAKGKEGVRDAQEREKVEQRIAALRDRQSRDEKARDVREKGLTKSLDIATGAQAGGGKGPGGDMRQLLGAIGIPTSTMALVALGATIAGKIIAQTPSLSRETTEATGSAVQGLIGSPLQGLAGGDMLKTAAFRGEWDSSQATAAKERNSFIKQFGQRMFTGKGWGSMFENTAKFIQGAGSSDRENAYQAEQDRQQAENTQSLYGAEVQKNPLKMMAVNKYQQNYMRDLGAQRMMGLSDSGYYGAGGFQQNANNGFNEELGLGMANQIQAAGGSTRAMSGSMRTGLLAQRDSNLTNAGGILGKISGTTGGSGATNEVFKRLMSESVKAGLDRSEFREEQRRFSDAAADIISGSGVKTGADAEGVLAGFSRFLGNNQPTIKGIEGAKSAYGQAQALSSETSGRAGALQFSAFLQSPVLNKAGGMGMGGLMEMPEKDINASNPFVISEATKVGVSPAELVTEIKQAKRRQLMSLIKLDEGKVGHLKDSLQKRKLGTSLSQKQLKGLSSEDQSTYQAAREQTRRQFGYNSPQEDEANFANVIGLEGKGVSGGKPGQTMGNAAVAASGVVAQELLENFRIFTKQMTPTTKALSDFMTELVSAAAMVRLVSGGNQSEQLRLLAEAARKRNQAQAGTPGGTK